MTRAEPRLVLAALVGYPPVEGSQRVAAVGGFVRDVLLERIPRELDLVVEGDAEALARSFGGTVTVHEPFGTASVHDEDWRIDVAMARRETYPRPGALPEVTPATIEEDLRRRDFTINAIAVTLDGELVAAEHALEDLEAGVMRVLHERSFIDDPTRLIRLARYAQRLGFAVEPRTAELAAAANLETLSGARLGGELRLALGEQQPLAVLERLRDALPFDLDPALAEAALALAPADADRAMLVLGAAQGDPAWIERIELTARERAVVAACREAAVPADTRPSALWRAWRRTPVEAVALAGARGDQRAARAWIETLRHVRLEIDGHDLIAAGIAEGEEIGRRLERALLAKLDGELGGGRDAELAFATGEG
jgi:tRNA nucleotidyltransferase (CCA-adding enzyme)